MVKRNRSVGVLIGCAILLAVPGNTRPAKQSASKVTLEQLTSAAKHYFRDTAEFPLVQKMTMTATNVSGRVIKRQNFSGDYVFHGYSQRTKSSYGQVHGEVSIWGVM